jgi:hypothetical protein
MNGERKYCRWDRQTFQVKSQLPLRHHDCLQCDAQRTTTCIQYLAYARKAAFQTVDFLLTAAYIQMLVRKKILQVYQHDDEVGSFFKIIKYDRSRQLWMAVQQLKYICGFMTLWNTVALVSRAITIHSSGPKDCHECLGLFNDRILYGACVCWQGGKGIYEWPQKTTRKAREQENMLIRDMHENQWWYWLYHRIGY